MLFIVLSLVIFYQTGSVVSWNVSLSPTGPISIWQNAVVNLTCDGPSSTYKTRFSLDNRDIPNSNKGFEVTVMNNNVSVLTIYSVYMITCVSSMFSCRRVFDSRIYVSNRVQVEVKPLIQNVNISQTEGIGSRITENMTVNFICSTSCTCTRPSIEWNVRDRDTIQFIDNHTECLPSTNSTTSRLTYMVNRLDNGSYVNCAASNENGHTVYSSNITLIVYYPPGHITMSGGSEDGYNVIVHTRGALTCTVNGGNPLPTLSWNYPPRVDVFNDVSIWEGESLDITCIVLEGNPRNTCIKWARGLDSRMWTTRQLNITSVKRTDSSTYTCTAWNVMHPTNRSAVNGTHSRVLTLDVKYETTIKLFSVNASAERRNYYLPENTTFELVCQADGNPLPSMTVLFMNNTMKQKTSSQKVSVYKLASCSDLGEYTCQASNRDGQLSTRSINIYVFCLPRQNPEAKHKLIAASDVNGNVTFSYTTLAYPYPIFTWYRHGSLIHINDPRTNISTSNLQTNLTIYHVEKNDFGPFMLHVSNDVGSIVELFDLKPQETKSSTSQDATGIVVGTICGVVVLCGILLSVFIYRRRSIIASESTAAEQTQPNLPVPYENLNIDPIPNVSQGNQNEATNDQLSETNVDHTYEGLSSQDNGSKDTYDDLHTQR